MELFDVQHLHALVVYLHLHPYIGGLITFGIAFLESIALIGGLVPGSVVMTAIGALIGSGAMPMAPTILWAIAGAFVGDFLSYGIGAYYNERLRKMWPFCKHPQWLAVGENFFTKHGGKSVLIGRFFGPVRSLVPLIAGLLHMSIPRFILADALAAILWSVVYIMPGVVVGALSLELPPETATKFILIVLGIVAFGWVVVVLLHLSFKTMVLMADRGMGRLWQYFEKHKATHWLTTLLSESNKPHPHRQLTLALFVLLCVMLFLWVFYSVFTHGPLTHLNEPVFELLRSLHTRVGDDIMLAATLLGDKHVQLVSALFIFGWFVWKRYIWAAMHWLSVTFLSVGAVEMLKNFYYSARPTGLLHSPVSSSFPSGHTILVTALFGFLAMLIAHYSSPTRRKIPLLIASFFILSVALSRIYLGEHWLTDVLGGLFLGLACAGLVHLSYLRCESKHLPVAKLTQVAVGIFLVTWVTYGVLNFHTLQEDDTLYWPTVTMDATTWWQRPHSEIPLFILSRLGKPETVLNVEFLGTTEGIKNILMTQGWQDHPIRLNWKGSLNRLSPKANPEHLPVWPSLYQNQAPVLMMTKSAQGHPALYFMLWKSNITLADSQQILWLGSVHYFLPRVHDEDLLTMTPTQTHQLYEDAMRIFKTALRGKYISQMWYISGNEQPAVMLPLDWDGKLLLIKEKK